MNPAIDRDFDAHLERVREFLRIPSVSAYDGDLRSTAAAVCELIEAAGGTAEIAEPGERRPTVIGVIDGPGPTVLRYGTYDVQPPGGLVVRAVRGGGRRRTHLRARRRQLEGRAGRQPARVRGRRQPVPPGAADYTQALVEAVPPRKQRSALGGELPDPAALPAGCRFHPRCPKRFEPRDQVDPELYPVGEPAHEAACLLLRGDSSPESRSDIA